jgi:hypothetical protein
MIDCYGFRQDAPLDAVRFDRDSILRRIGRRLVVLNPDLIVWSLRMNTDTRVRTE